MHEWKGSDLCGKKQFCFPTRLGRAAGVCKVRKDERDYVCTNPTTEWGGRFRKVKEGLGRNSMGSQTFNLISGSFCFGGKCYTFLFPVVLDAMRDYPIYAYSRGEGFPGVIANQSYKIHRIFDEREAHAVRWSCCIHDDNGCGTTYLKVKRNLPMRNGGPSFSAGPLLYLYF